MRMKTLAVAVVAAAQSLRAVCHGTATTLPASPCSLYWQARAVVQQQRVLPRRACPSAEERRQQLMCCHTRLASSSRSQHAVHGVYVLAVLVILLQAVVLGLRPHHFNV